MTPDAPDVAEAWSTIDVRQWMDRDDSVWRMAFMPRTIIVSDGKGGFVEYPSAIAARLRKGGDHDAG